MPIKVYMLRLTSGGIYVGATEDLDRRFSEHQRGVACRTTRLDPPVGVIYTEEHLDFPSARKREAQLKRWAHAKKEALAAGDTARLKALAKRRAK